MLAAWSSSLGLLLCWFKKRSPYCEQEFSPSFAMQKHTFTLTILALFISCAVTLSAPDTPETGRHEAERYLQATPPKALFEDMADKMAANLPPDQRDQFKKLVTSQLDIAALTKAMIDSMVKHFTTEELKALADFYGSPVGKSRCKSSAPIWQTSCQR